jgi:hypothetical protein
MYNVSWYLGRTASIEVKFLDVIPIIILNISDFTSIYLKNLATVYEYCEFAKEINLSRTMNEYFCL